MLAMSTTTKSKREKERRKWVKSISEQQETFSEQKEIEEGKNVEKDLREMLKTGVIVTYRNGEEGIVFVGASFDNDKIINLGDGCYTELKSVNADLSADWGDEGYDIVKIENYDDLSDTWRMLGKNVEQSWNTPVRKVVWMRESEEKVKLKEVISKLEKDLKEAQNKLNTL